MPKRRGASIEVLLALILIIYTILGEKNREALEKAVVQRESRLVADGFIFMRQINSIKIARVNVLEILAQKSLKAVKSLVLILALKGFDVYKA